MIRIIGSVLKFKLKVAHVKCKRIMVQIEIVKIDMDGPLYPKRTVFFELILHIQVGLSVF